MASLNGIAPVITGRNLRNYLAHDSLAYDVLSGSTLTVEGNAVYFVRHQNRLYRNGGKHPFVLPTMYRFDEKLGTRITKVPLIPRIVSLFSDSGQLESFFVLLPSQSNSLFVSPMYKQNIMVHWAVLHGNLQLVMEILDRHQLIDETNFFGETALTLAVRYGYQDIAQYLIQQGADVHLGMWCPVWIAARLGDLSMIELLGARPPATCNPLVAAMQHDHFEVFEYLHRELGYQFGDDWLLQKAVQLGRTKFVRYILEHTNEPTMVDEIGYAGFNPLMTAAISGHSDVFELLLEFGANPSAISDYDYTMLHCAVSGSNQKIIDFVLQLPNVDLNAVTKDDGNPLKIVIGHGNLDLVRYLLGKGAKPRVEDVILAGKNYCYNILQVFLDQDSTLLDVAPESLGLNWKMVEHLIARGFNLNARARDGYTTLHVAAAVNNLKICNRLLDSGCDINTFSYDYKTALVIALENKYIKLAKLLLDRGADRDPVRNFRDSGNKNATLLHKFARKNRRFMVRYLLEEFNFDKTVTDDEGKTALDWAREAGHDDVVRLLA